MGDLALAKARSSWCGNDTQGTVEFVSGASGKLIARRQGPVCFQLEGTSRGARLETWNRSLALSVRVRFGIEDQERWERPRQGFGAGPARFAGHLDGDADEEIVSCERWEFHASPYPSGPTVVCRAGRDGEVLWWHTEPGEDFARDVATAGHVDGDARPDLAVLSRATFTVLSGADGTVLEQRPFSPLGQGNVLRRLDSAGDLDRDGRLDFVVEGERGGNSVPPVLVSGRTLEPIDLAGGSFSFWAAGGDLDGDGNEDLVVGRTGDEHVLAVVSGGRVEELARFDPDEMDWSDVDGRAVVGRLGAGDPWQVLVTTRGASWQSDGRSRVLLIPGR